MPGIYVVLKALFNMKSGLVGKSQVRHGDALPIFEHQLSGEKKENQKRTWTLEAIKPVISTECIGLITKIHAVFVNGSLGKEG